MGFYNLEAKISSLLQADRRKDRASHHREEHAASALKLKAKLRELRACGVSIEVDDDDLVDTASPKPADPTATHLVV